MLFNVRNDDCEGSQTDTSARCGPVAASDHHETDRIAVDPTAAEIAVKTASTDVPAAAITSPAVTVPVSIEEHRAAVLQRRDEAERLGDDIAELAARIQAATYELLVMIRAFDEREGWSGLKSCAHWLNWRTGLALGAAREKVRVARALGDLPLLSDAMQRGRVSYSKVRALTRVATAVNENRLLDFALCAPASYVERLARVWRRVDLQAEAADEQRRHERRNLTTWVDDDRMVVIRGRLSPEVGASHPVPVDGALDVSAETVTGVAPIAANGQDAAVVRMLPSSTGARQVSPLGGTFPRRRHPDRLRLRGSPTRTLHRPRQPPLSGRRATRRSKMPMGSACPQRPLAG